MAADELERTTMRRIFWRLMPLLMFGSAMSYLDRVNLGFAALTMNKDLGLSSSAFGVASGAFFITYALLEIPSNLILAKVGARRWLARIMISWGVVSAATALASGFVSLVALRVLLGAAEAGFTPGVFVLMTFWFPQRYRGRAVAAFLTAQVVGVIFGASVSGPLLAVTAWGLHGWQWMFLVQGGPTVLAGIVLLATFAERPQDAKWLSPAQKAWLEGELAAERRALGEGAGSPRLLSVLLGPRVLVLAFVYLLAATGSFALTFFMPQILREAGLSLTMTGFSSAFVWACSALGVMAWGLWVDRTRRPERVVAIACFVFAAGYWAMAPLQGSLLLIPLMCVAGLGSRSAVSSFWALPGGFVHPAAIGTVIAFISSVGNLGGLLGPSLFGLIRENTGSYAAGMLAAGGLGLLGGALALWSGSRGRTASRGFGPATAVAADAAD